jgi:hypothetical protein
MNTRRNQVFRNTIKYEIIDRFLGQDIELLSSERSLDFHQKHSLKVFKNFENEQLSQPFEMSIVWIEILKSIESLKQYFGVILNSGLHFLVLKTKQKVIIDETDVRYNKSDRYNNRFDKQ